MNKELVTELKKIQEDLDRGLSPCDQNVETDTAVVISAVYKILDLLLRHVESNLTAIITEKKP